MKLKELLAGVILLAATGFGVQAEENWYYNDFEAKNDLSFMACYQPWISDLRRAEAEGYIKVHQSGITDQNEGKSHSGVRSFALDVSLDKSTSKWGGRCYWRGPNLAITLDRPVYLSGYLYPQEVPPDVELGLGVLFDAIDRATGEEIKGGSLIIKSQGTNPEGWLVIQEDVAALVGKKYRDAVMTGWQIVIHSPKAFHGQRVKLLADDIAVRDQKDAIATITGDGRRQEITVGGPYTVKYLSLHREAPSGAVNLIDNSSFELGLKSWEPAVYADTEALNSGQGILPPADAYAVVDDPVTLHGRRSFRISRPDGVSNEVKLTSAPIQIEDGATYSVSFSARSDHPTTLRVNGRMFSLTEQWTRFLYHEPKIVCYTRWNGHKFPGRYRLELSHKGIETVWLDAIQMQHGDATPYTLPATVEFSLAPTTPLGTVFDGEPAAFRADLWNGTTQDRNVVINFLIRDFSGNEIRKSMREMKLMGGSGNSIDVPLSTDNSYRHFKIEAELWTDGQSRRTATTAVAVIPDLRQLRGNDFFGSLISSSNPANFRQSLELNRNAGMKLMPIYNTVYISRAPTDWRKENPQWNRLEFVLNQLEKYGFTPLPTIYDPIPAKAKKDVDGAALITPADEQEVFDYCREAAQRFRNRVKYWEVFAEYMKDPLTNRAVALAKLLPSAYRGLKQGNPDCYVIACGEDAARERAMLRQLEAHFKLGTLQSMDAVSLHPYFMPHSPEAVELPRQLAELRQMMRNYNKGRVLPIWGTEVGCQGADVLYYDDIDAESLYYPKFITELQQADYMVRENLIFFGEEVAHNCSFFLDSGQSGSMMFVRRDNGVAPKTVYPAICQVVSRLSGAVPVRRFDRSADQILGYGFRHGNKPFAALWQYDPDHQPLAITLPISTTKLKVFNLVGEEVPLTPSGEARLTLTGSPLYLDAVDLPEAEFFAAIDRLQAEKLTVKLAMTDGKTLAATVSNGGSAVAEGKLTFTLPSFWPSPKSDTVQLFSLTPQASKVFTLVLPSIPAMSSPTAVSVRAQAGKKSAHSKILPLFCTRAVIPPALDGNGSDFAISPALALGRDQWVSLYEKAKWGGSADLSAEVRMLWDTSAFYLEVKVYDDIYSTPHSASGMLWANDALQLAWQLPDGSPYIEASVSLNDKGPELALNHGKLELTKIRTFASRIADNGIIYRLAVPWAALGDGFAPEGTIWPAFNLAVSDNDGHAGISPDKLKGYSQSLQISAGLVESKSPECFGRLLLLP